MLSLWLVACTLPVSPPDPGTPDPGTPDPGTTDPVPTDTGTPPQTTPPGLPSRLANGGFESGETWWRPGGGYVSHAWAVRGEPIHGSAATFEPLEGEHAQKIWGSYIGTVPNDSEHGLTLVDLTPGDAHVFTARALTHPDDAVSGGSAAVLFLRFVDGSGAVLHEAVSAPIDHATERGVWHTLRVEAEVPAGAVAGALGLRFTLADWSAGGSVYLDDASWTSTGTGRVDGERLLVWNDEFDGTGIDESRWTRLELPAFRYNGEQQAYTASPDNADVRDGQLVITARRETDGTITSARLVTDGKGDWTYGRIEGMVQVPSGVGTWPALWMLPTDWSYGGWPASGEIDIMEHVGCDVDVVHATVHTGAYNHVLGTQQGGSTTRDATASMHLYAVDWGPDDMAFTVDGEEIFRFANDGAGDPDTWPFGERFHVVVNLAFGGSWGGFCGVDVGALPQEYRLDWIRVYQ